jgi:hypothetical protein
MDLQQCIQLMTDNAERIRLLAQGVSDQQARWKPDASSWSILEVINHLDDEEREDFRMRLDIILHHPDQPWPPIDPEGWVHTRSYNERDLDASIQNFLAERQRSLAWLGTLSSPDWDAMYEAPFGSIRAGDMMAAWVTHDQLHLRQLIELHRAYTVQLAVPYQVHYAGPW